MNKKITIGRSSSSDIKITETSGNVSRHHATLYVVGSRMEIEDHSTNGTFVNGKRIHNNRTEVTQSDEIKFGNMVRLSWSEVNRIIERKSRQVSGKSSEKVSDKVSKNESGKIAKQPVTINKMWIWAAACVIVVAIIVGVMFSNMDPNDGSRRATNTNCRIFSPYNGDFTWSGTCAKKYAEGQGTIEWATGQKYVGEVHNGHISGKGKEYSGSRLVYDGDFVDGKREGFGSLYHDDAQIVKRQGFFNDGEFLNEAKAQELCAKTATELVSSYFNGGDNVVYKLYYYSEDLNKTQFELIFDLEFSKNNAFYKCRVKARQPGSPALEILDGNENVIKWQNKNTDSDGILEALFGKVIGGLLNMAGDFILESLPTAIEWIFNLF
ncbi:MAG: FHA domain-containing protein [Tannerella sp.]|jgi:pSer/pThr/pTyr-binding forkhead associated (FHA) protein|nr:FHA domain-containing protein [Tannerella sp.]